MVGTLIVLTFVTLLVLVLFSRSLVASFASAKRAGQSVKSMSVGFRRGIPYVSVEFFPREQRPTDTN